MPANLFTTNSDTGNLGQRLRELISASRETRALVSFFYFSGVKDQVIITVEQQGVTVEAPPVAPNSLSG